MSPKSKNEYISAIKERYRKSTKQEKKLILNELCLTCNYNRKYAIRLLNQKFSQSSHRKSKRRGRKKKYHNPIIAEILREIWIVTNLPCSKRLKAILPIWLPYYPYEIPQDVYNLLLTISHATIDRIMKVNRVKYYKKGLSTTKPGTLIKKQIPIKTNQWDESIPGFLETDSVAHCGSSASGMFAYTINCVDIATCWTEQRAVWGKGEQGVIKVIENIENSLPFALKGFDCDNGSEFINWHLHRYLNKRKQPIQFTRSRAYYKNDNAHVEEKNWTNIRQYLGYLRFDKKELVDQLNDLYTTEWRLYFNFFIPSVKLIEKYRKGSQIIKKYDLPKTPLQRIFESRQIPRKTKDELNRNFKELNPFLLQKTMAMKIKKILRMARE